MLKFNVFPKGRLFSYDDTARYRLGPNYKQIPVNCPYRCMILPLNFVQL